jgi:hypothetical protein
VSFDQQLGRSILLVDALLQLQVTAPYNGVATGRATTAEAIFSPKSKLIVVRKMFYIMSNQNLEQPLTHLKHVRRTVGISS